MEKIVVGVLSNQAVCSQVVTGFYLLGRRGDYRVKIENRISDPHIAPHSAFVLVDYHGARIAYDMLDGYQDEAAIRHYLTECDFYFKRSYSKSGALRYGVLGEKMHPLGFNYFITFAGSPIHEPFWKSLVKPLLGRKPQSYFSSKIYESAPAYKERDIKVSFWARLWDEQAGLTEELRQEREEINGGRVAVVKALKDAFGPRFCGGLSDSGLARQIAPDLIVDKRYEKKEEYLRLLHECDIGVGTAGLHKSIGWKVGEYISAAMAVVHEPFHYQVPGSFEEGKNYLKYSSPEGCVDAVEALMRSPDRLFEMKQKNRDYYLAYLEPCAFVQNTLKVVDGSAIW